MKQCSAYSETKPVRDLPAVTSKEDESAAYEICNDNNSVYEKIPGDP